MKSARYVIVLVVAACLPAIRSKSDEPAKAESGRTGSMAGSDPGDVRDDNALTMKIVWCPAGIVPMEQVDTVDAQGEPTSTSVVTTFLTQGYWIGKYEVTQGEWKKLMRSEPWKDQIDTREGDDFPATWVNWDDAMAFCRRLTQEERQAGRLGATWEYTLPTEAQWERACRARTETRYSFGDDESKLGDYAWYYGNALRTGEHYAHRVGKKKPNPWGLHDMQGNVGEWCRDYYSGKLPGGRDPEVTVPSPERVLRGGVWYTRAEYCRSSLRYKQDPATRLHSFGFRVALSPVRPVR